MASTQSPKQDIQATGAAEQPTSSHAPKPPSVGQQVVLTVKLLVGGAAFIGLLWLLDRVV